MSQQHMTRVAAMSEDELRSLGKVVSEALFSVNAFRPGANATQQIITRLHLDLLDLANHKHNTEGQMAKKPAKADPVAAKVAADLGLAEGQEPKPQPRQDGIVMTLKVRCVDLAALVATARAIRETMPDFGQEIIEFAAEIGHGTHDLHEL